MDVSFLLFDVFPYLIPVKPYVVGVASDKIIQINAIDSRWAIHSFLLSIGENCRVLQLTFLPLGFFCRSKFPFQFGHLISFWLSVQLARVNPD